MYYKFEKTFEIRDDKVDLQTILQKAKQVFEESRFDNIKITNDTVQFHNNFWEFGSPVFYRTHVTKGSLTVSKEEFQTKVIYRTYAPFLGYLFILFFICIVGIFHIIDFLFIGCFILLIGIIMSYLIIRRGEIGIIDKLKEKIEYDKTSVRAHLTF